MTQEDFVAALVCRPNASLQVHDDVVASVGERLRQLPDEQQFQILFPIAVKSQSHDLPVLDAATLLDRLSPACPVSCENAVMTLLPEWDVSIEQVVFYLAARFGSERVKEATRTIEQQVTTERDKTTLRTIVYWVGNYDETRTVQS
jgi:hypothetical protein